MSKIRLNICGISIGFVFCLTLLFACTHPQSYRAIECPVASAYEKVNLHDLTDNISAYHGKFVEVTGKYESGFEYSRLRQSGLFLNHNKKAMLWISFNCKLLSSDGKAPNRFDDGVITIRGKVDTAFKGHLSQYAASISEIIWLEVN
jgi:hypothetical protein